MSRELDPQSKAMWDELRNTTPVQPSLVEGERHCCKMVREAIRAGNTHLWYRNISIQIYYCASCGRRLR